LAVNLEGFVGKDKVVGVVTQLLLHLGEIAGLVDMDIMALAGKRIFNKSPKGFGVVGDKDTEIDHMAFSSLEVIEGINSTIAYICW
jgi:hypothetical protein